MQSIGELRRSLESSLPPIVPRSGIQKYGIPYSEGFLANLDSRGEGPAGAVKIGRKVCYPRDSLITWLIARSTAKDREAR